MAEKKRIENEAQKLEHEKKEAMDKEAARPPRPFNPQRMAAMSQPKMKRPDPNTKPEPKAKRVSMQTRKEL